MGVDPAVRVVGLHLARPLDLPVKGLVVGLHVDAGAGVDAVGGVVRRAVDGVEFHDCCSFAAAGVAHPQTLIRL